MKQIQLNIEEEWLENGVCIQIYKVPKSISYDVKLKVAGKENTLYFEGNTRHSQETVDRRMEQAISALLAEKEEDNPYWLKVHRTQEQYRRDIKNAQFDGEITKDRIYQRLTEPLISAIKAIENSYD